MSTLSNEDIEEIVELIRTIFKEHLNERERKFDALCTQFEEKTTTRLSEADLWTVLPKSMAPSRIYRPPSANDRQYNPQCNSFP